VPIRPIQSTDNAVVAAGIREVFADYGCTGPGFSPSDPEMDYLHKVYSQPGHGYFIWEDAGAVLGGCGFGPHGPADQAVCELRKLYLLPAARGTGAGEQLMLHTLEKAREQGYQQCYLETVKAMTEATGLYEKHGFRALDAPMFGGGHHACDRWYARALSILLLCFLVLLPACSGPRVAASSQAVRSPELRVELIEMQLDAQEMEAALIEKGIVNLRLTDIYAQRRLFQEHASRLKEILTAYGWPSRALIGQDGLEALADVVMNADHDPRFQRECLNLMKEAWTQGEGDGPRLAALTDWVRVAEGLPQVYGTQADFIEGRLQFHPIESTAQVDARRAAMGLVPLLEYKNQLEEAHLIRKR
jgi:putative acetyltransferase